jgi:hypothetical protein
MTPCTGTDGVETVHATGCGMFVVVSVPLDSSECDTGT